MVQSPNGVELGTRSDTGRGGIDSRVCAVECQCCRPIRSDTHGRGFFRYCCLADPSADEPALNPLCRGGLW